MTSASYSASRPPLRERLAYQLRVLRAIAGVEFRMKYVDSALGYVVLGLGLIVATLFVPFRKVRPLWELTHLLFSPRRSCSQSRCCLIGPDPRRGQPRAGPWLWRGAPGFAEEA